MRGESGNGVWIFLLLYMLLGVYFINVPFGFFETPQFLLDVNEWLSLAAGVLLVLGGINYKRASSNKI